jgi:hypothetical protein
MEVMMADINTLEQFERTNRVYVSGLTEKNTKADRDGIGDFSVLMYSPDGAPREPKLRHVERLMREKNFKVGKSPVARPVNKPASRKQAKQELKTLVSDSGA